MQIDLFGKKRWKVNFHMHTNLSDGAKTPDEALAIYKAAGYDAVAITDHWVHGAARDFDGMAVIPGIEYNTRGGDGIKGFYHILGIGMAEPPAEGSISRDSTPQEIIDAIHACGGMAVVAHPAWSLNRPEDMAKLKDVDATEIFNTISGVYMSRRADSSVVLDMLACLGVRWPLLATDDVHYYGEDGPCAYVMVESDAPTASELIAAVRQGRFYATQGPEVHLYRDGDSLAVRSSPVKEIVFLSNLAWSRRAFTGAGITEARYTPAANEPFVRVEVIDAEGRKGWTNYIEC